MQTFRRLNDPERYYGLSVRGWVLVAAGVGVLYLAVRVSPLAVKPTISITLIALTLAGGVLLGVSGQAIGPGRFLLAVIAHAATRSQLTLDGKPDRGGVTLTEPPPEPVIVTDPVLTSLQERRG
jgi:hypothetical protein